MGTSPGVDDDWYEPNCDGMDDDTALALLRTCAEAEMGPIGQGGESGWRLLGYVPKPSVLNDGCPYRRLGFYKGFVRGRAMRVRLEGMRK